MKNKTLIIVILLFAVGCSTSSDNISNIFNARDIIETKNVISNDDIDMEYSVIPLEFNDQTMMSGVFKIIPIDDYIFVLTTESKIMQFTNKGKFVRSISKMGRGPSEYLYVNDIFVNPKKDRIYLNDMGGKILEYDFSGNATNSYSRNRGMKTMIMGSDNVVYESIHPLIGNEPHRLLVKNLEGKTLDSVINNLKFEFKQKSGFGAYAEHKSLFELNGDIVFHQHTTDTVFTYKDGKSTVRYVFDFDRVLDSEIYGNFRSNKDNLNLLYDYTEDEDFIYPTLIETGWNITPYMIRKKDNSVYKLDLYFDATKSTKFTPKWVYGDLLVDYIDGGENSNISVVIVNMKDVN